MRRSPHVNPKRTLPLPRRRRFCAGTKEPAADKIDNNRPGKRRGNFQRAEDESRFQQIRRQYAVDEKPGAVFYDHRQFSKLLHKTNRSPNHFRIGARPEVTELTLVPAEAPEPAVAPA